MLNDDGNENGKKLIGLISTKTALHVQHTFLYISLPFFCTTTTSNFLVTYFIDEMSYMFLLAFFSPAAHIYLGGL